jgi:hypothetical protein
MALGLKYRREDTGMLLIRKVECISGLLLQSICHAKSNGIEGMGRGYKIPSSGMHKWTKDLIGKTFGKLTVVEFVGYRGQPTRHAHWKCVCTCGKERDVRATRLLHGKVSACAECSVAEGAVKGGNTRSLSGDEGAFRRLFDYYRNNARKTQFGFRS